MRDAGDCVHASRGFAGSRAREPNQSTFDVSYEIVWSHINTRTHKATWLLPRLDSCSRMHSPSTSRSSSCVSCAVARVAQSSVQHAAFSAPRVCRPRRVSASLPWRAGRDARATGTRTRRCSTPADCDTTCAGGAKRCQQARTRSSCARSTSAGARAPCRRGASASRPGHGRSGAGLRATPRRSPSIVTKTRFASTCTCGLGRERRAIITTSVLGVGCAKCREAGADPGHVRFQVEVSWVWVARV